jgi:two-component system, NarL family, invasion response regulator UvrY
MIRVLIADDHPIVRRGLRQILADEPDLDAPGEAQNGHEVLKQLQQPWDVLVLDINMPGRSGLEILHEVKDRRPDLPVLIMSIHSEEQFGVRALKAGAAGYLNKESAPEELVKAIRKVHGGGKYVSPTLGEQLAVALQFGEHRMPHDALSNRENEILCLIASGKTVSEIAEHLILSVKTVSTYRSRILEKMKLHTNAELMHYAIQNRLVEPLATK